MVSKCDLTEISGRGVPSVYGLRFKDMSTAARKRLWEDLKTMDKDAPGGVSAAPEGDDIMLWNAIICGPSDTPWDGGIFKLTLKFTEEYPHKPPEVRFVSTMFHPNIYEDGRIDLDILQWPWWNPVYDVVAVLISVQSMLCDPDVKDKDPANDIAAKMFSTDEWEYNKRVLEIVRKELDALLDLVE